MMRQILAMCTFGLLLSASYSSFGQPNLKDTAKVNELLAISKNLTINAPDSAISYSLEAKKLAEQLRYKKGVAAALKYIGIVHFTHGENLEAINYWRQSMEVFKSLNDLAGVANIHNNIGVIYSIQGAYEKALENYLASLKYAEQSGDEERITSALNNLGATYALKPETYDKALDYYAKGLAIAEKNKDTNNIGTTAVNIGEVYSNKGNSELALQYFLKSLKAYKEAGNNLKIPYTYNAIAKEYRKAGQYDEAIRSHNTALATAEKVDNKLYRLHSLIGLASTYKEKGAVKQALRYFKQAETLGNTINALDELKDVYQGLSATYAHLNQFNKAFEYQSRYTDVKDSLYNIETNKKLASMEFDFNLQKKQGEIDLLLKDKDLKAAELRRQKLAQNALLAGLLFIFIIAFIIYRNYRIKVKINKVLDRQKEQIESLLLNILPAEVAKELQDSGSATPRYYANVSVLFTDFKGFTVHTNQMSPEALVEELNNCFMAFDNIIEKYNLEKIKTIGDAYMCAGGIPTPDQTHPFRMVKAAIEIQEFMHRYNLNRVEKGLPSWEIRIGIHVGPVIAGVVGKKKYAYDIWGSTVNIASRMESSGAPGRINISSALYNVIKDKYICSPRGRVYAKNVGDVDMYFLEHEVKEPIKSFEPDVLLQ